MIRLAVLWAALILAGCASKPTPEPEVRLQKVEVPYEVKVPVYVKPTAPGELVRPYKPTELPTFVSPSDPAAAVALDEANLNRLKVILRTLTTRDDAWRAWYVEPVKNGDGKQ